MVPYLEERNREGFGCGDVLIFLPRLLILVFQMFTLLGCPHSCEIDNVFSGTVRNLRIWDSGGGAVVVGTRGGVLVSNGLRKIDDSLWSSAKLRLLFISVFILAQKLSQRENYFFLCLFIIF